jgi:ABC-type transport system involved in cytochrome c biogenesis ATPase subunit
MNSKHTCYLQDIEYTHLLYNSFGPLTCKIYPNSFVKFQTNNGTGKTILLKTLIGLLLPKSGVLTITKINNKQKYLTNNRLSNSQSKKYKLLYQNISKNFIWIFDEPYSFLDITSIIYYKKKITTHVNKLGTVLITDCVKKTMLPCIIYYTHLQWL